MINPKVEMLKLEGIGKVGNGSGRLLKRTTDMTYNLEQPRLINPFTLGCDPEFCFIEGGRTITANSFGLGINSSYGRDGSGVPCELRAAPSRFALRVVASLLEALRLLAVDKKESLKGSWWAEPVVNGHPVGGHLHFGVKRTDNRDCELGALDRTTQLMVAAGIWDREQIAARIAHGYGRHGDHRKQEHGWEYRVLPTWLRSPGVAHLTLTIAKLAMRDWRLWGVVDLPKDTGAGRDRLGNILAAYRYLDDDAALALKGFPDTLNSSPLLDMKATWGINPKGDETLPSGYKAPRELVPSIDSVAEVADRIAEQRTLPFHLPAMANREQNGAPAGYKWVNLHSIQGDPSSYTIQLCAVKGWNFKVESTRFIARISIPLFVLAAMTQKQIEDVHYIGKLASLEVRPQFTPMFSFPQGFIESYLNPSSKFKEALFGRSFGPLPLYNEEAATVANRLWWNKRLRLTKAVSTV